MYEIQVQQLYELSKHGWLAQVKYETVSIIYW